MHDKLTIERLGQNALDVRELQREALLTDEWLALQQAFRWPRITRMLLYRHRIVLELRNQLPQQNIRVSWTRCHFGGTRPWLHCPFCQRRVARLFRGFGGYFCRACCGNPIYESQRRSKKARAYLEAYRLRQRLGGSKPVRDPIRPRPRGMKQKTYDRICARIVSKPTSGPSSTATTKIRGPSNKPSPPNRYGLPSSASARKHRRPYAANFRIT